MEATLKIWKTNRKIISDLIGNYNIEQLNLTPAGFSNNLAWNLGHIVVAQQSLIYRGCGLEANIPVELMELYKPGTKPNGQTTEQQVSELKDLLLSVIPQTEADYPAGKFERYNVRTTSTGFHLATVADAFEFNNYHEGMHLGMMLNIRKFL